MKNNNYVVLKRGDLIEFFNSAKKKDAIKIENIKKKGCEDLTEEFATFCNITECEGKIAQYFFKNRDKSFKDYCWQISSVRELNWIHNS